MKAGKKPTVAQRKFIKKNGLIPENWFVSKDTPEHMLLIHRHLGRIKTIHKGEKEK